MRYIYDLTAWLLTTWLLYVPILIWLAAFLFIYRRPAFPRRMIVLWSLLVIFPIVSIAELILSFLILGSVSHLGPPL
jgi:hypothetical protein